MNPLVGSYKLAVTEACRKSRVEGGYLSVSSTIDGGVRGRANSGERSSSSLGLSGVPRSASQGRSLSLGRSSTPIPLALSSTVVPGSTGIGGGGGGGSAAGPTWLQEVTNIFEVASRLFTRLEAKTDTDRWAVGIAIAATWKGMLGCSARIISEDGVVPSSTASNSNSSTGGGVPTSSTTAVPAPVKNRLLGSVKKTPSPPPSPPLPAVSLSTSSTPGSTSSSATIAFVRLISDLELFEHRLTTFLTSTLSSPQVVFHPSAAPVDSCPGAPSCGLCKTGRTFDEESDSSDEEGHSNEIPGKESRLALSAMREAMQALSSMIVVVRASRDLKVIEQALRSDYSTSSSASTSAAPSSSKPSNAPLTPSDLFALGPAKPTNSSAAPPPPPSASTTSITIVSPAPAHPLCPTLRSAIIDLHPLILLHLILSRLPRSLPFRLPHEIWDLKAGWNEYESELRGFAAGEEWAGEVAWEVKGEIVRVRQEEGGLRQVEENALKVLEETVERVSRDSA